MKERKRVKDEDGGEVDKEREEMKIGRPKKNPRKENGGGEGEEKEKEG